MRTFSLLILLIAACFLKPNMAMGQKFPFNFNWDQPDDFPSSMEESLFKTMTEKGFREVLEISTYEDGHRTLQRIELDAKGRLTKISNAPFNELFIEYLDFVYDGEGRLRQVRGGGLNKHNVSYAYDWGDRISLEEYSVGRGVEKPVGREYFYDRKGQLSKVIEKHGTFEMVYNASYRSGKCIKVKAVGEGEAYKWYKGDSVIWRSPGDGLRMMQPPESKLCKSVYNHAGNPVSHTWSNTKPFPKEIVLVEEYRYDETDRLIWRRLATTRGSGDREKENVSCETRFRLDEYQYREDGLLKEVKSTRCEDGPKPEISVKTFQYK